MTVKPYDEIWNHLLNVKSSVADAWKIYRECQAWLRAQDIVDDKISADVIAKMDEEQYLIFKLKFL
jgi:hypothetical protein